MEPEKNVKRPLHYQGMDGLMSLRNQTELPRQIPLPAPIDASAQDANEEEGAEERHGKLSAKRGVERRSNGAVGLGDGVDQNSAGQNEAPVGLPSRPENVR